jgi:hypothetical protein
MNVQDLIVVKTSQIANLKYRSICLKSLSFFVCILLVGCADKNPVQFSNPTKCAPETTQTAVSENESVPEKKSYTLLELYLLEKIEREYMMAWFFKDVRLYRDKLFLIKDEIYSKRPLSLHDRNRVLLLEAGMNDAIRKFNERNILSRTKDVAAAALHNEFFPKEKVKTEYTLEEIQKNGLPPVAISNDIYGFLGSLHKYGFQIEPVNFLDR